MNDFAGALPFTVLRFFELASNAKLLETALKAEYQGRDFPGSTRRLQCHDHRCAS